MYTQYRGRIVLASIRDCVYIYCSIIKQERRRAVLKEQDSIILWMGFGTIKRARQATKNKKATEGRERENDGEEE